MTTPFRLFTCTWNVAQEPPPDSCTHLLHLDEEELPELVAIGLQEQQAGLTQISDYIYEDPWTYSMTNVLIKKNFVRLTNVRTVGINLMVFVKRPWIPHITNLESVVTRLQFGKIWGGKGAVSVSFTLGGVNICVVNCHLAAHLQYFRARVEQYTSIVDTQKFRKLDASSILDHDYVFWFGDLNFRIDNVRNDDIRQKAKARELEVLLKNDQLKRAMSTGLLPSGFQEGPITFAPTYKFDKGTDTYDTSAKSRKPGFCDRVLWSVQKESVEGIKLDVKQLYYTSHPEYKQSDHKPVTSCFDIQILKDLPACPIVFDPVRDWVHSQDGFFSFTVKPGIKLASWDWIALFRMDCRSLENYKTYIWCGMPEEVKTRQSDGSTRVTSYFHNSYVQEHLGHYFLAYHNSARGSFIGFSEPFRIIRTREESFDDIDGGWSSSVDPEPPEPVIELD